jgi:F-type H+-transporting ATPase subunit epsilon
VRLKVLSPDEVLIDQESTKVLAEAGHGVFCLLPRHIDFVAMLVPGIVTFETPGREEQYVAVAEGVLVKCGQEVMISCLNAIRGDDLETLKATVEEHLRVEDEQQRNARSAMLKLEVNFVRRFVELGEKMRE